MTSLKDTIRESNDRESQLEEIPEWGVTVEVRSMTAKQRASIAQMGANQVLAANSEGGTHNGSMEVDRIYKDTIVDCVFDPKTGEKVFKVEDLEWLMEEKSGAVIERISMICLNISGIYEGAEDDAGKDS